MKYLTTIFLVSLFPMCFATTVTGVENYERRSTLYQSGEVTIMEELVVVGVQQFERRSTLLQTGEVASMEELLAILRTDFSGHILEVELENQGNGTSWVYEVKILHDNGSVAEIDYDAMSLTILEVDQDDD